MELYARIEQILQKLRPAFSREVPFEWFVLLMWGLLLSHQPAAVTSYVNGSGLDESSYGTALHWFDSRAFRVDEVCQRWGCWRSSHTGAQRLKEQLVYRGDGIKVGKEGRKMPGVKGLHQESAIRYAQVAESIDIQRFRRLPVEPAIWQGFQRFLQI